jgi:zinc transport system substrate-binding protein
MRSFVIAVQALFIALAAPAWGQTPPAVPVVASVLPIHSLVAGVMEGVGKPHLLVPGGASPHSFALRPSDASKLGEAKAVFWVGPTLETFLVRPLKALTQGATVVALAGAEGVTLLPFREGGPWDEQDDEHEHGHGAEAAHGHGDAHEHDHDHADHGIDAHVWLDPLNAVAFVGAIAAALEQADPANAKAYRANAGRMVGKLKALDAELRRTLAPAQGKPYIVFHDAYQYFESRYGLHPAGSITVNPELSPGARRLVDIRERIRSDKAVCVFAEPQFEPKLVRTVIEGTGTRIGTLDPLGAQLKPGPGAYFQLLRTLAKDLTTCLDGRS